VPKVLESVKGILVQEFDSRQEEYPAQAQTVIRWTDPCVIYVASPLTPANFSLYVQNAERGSQIVS